MNRSILPVLFGTALLILLGLEGGGTPLLVGNRRWRGPGGESVLLQKDGDITVFHAYDGQTGKPSIQISSIAWGNGWPQAALEDTPESQVTP